MKRVIASLCLIGTLGLAACATSGGSIYHPASSARGTGYSEQKLETNRFRVTFVGSDSTSAGTVQDFALLRAAELTLNMGYEWFTVVGRNTVNQDNGYGPRFSGMFGPPCGVFACGSGLYGGFWYDNYDSNRLSASLDIVMGKGAKPADPSSYDAKDVAATIRSNMAGRY